ncbi:fosfomycin resistance glutathione transferase [Inquilinus limosus]|uniref:fosfomycin resistance glutathione transferase n=1 Tax=Inquilinus limosus TaxID=171674 RepID=UPI003F185DB2
MVTGINHVTLAVSDVERSFRFYVDVLGLKPLAKWSRGAYLLAGDLWLCLSFDEKTRSSPHPDYTHIAFSVADFDACSSRLSAHGTVIWRLNQTEGPSVYFLDPDGHKLEIHDGDWRTRLQSMRDNPWEAGIEFFPIGLSSPTRRPRRGADDKCHR